MFEALFFTIGLLIGGMAGVMIMCLLQINRDGKEHDHE